MYVCICIYTYIYIYVYIYIYHLITRCSLASAETGIRKGDPANESFMHTDITCRCIHTRMTRDIVLQRDSSMHRVSI